MKDGGRELLALMVLLESDKTNWVAWTPEGFYAASTKAVGVLQWQINHGPDAAATTIRVSDVPSLNRPGALALALQERGIGSLGLDEAKAARDEVRRVVGAAKAPGARLHLLTIGVNNYGLKFADKDATELASTLFDTQDTTGPYKGSGGLYAEVKPQPILVNNAASKVQIFSKLASMQRIMAADDTAIVMFAGHGTIINGEFYLLPYNTDISEVPVTIAATAIAASEFQRQIEALASHGGRVLVLLDACHSAAFAPKADADVLRNMLAKGNVAVIASSQGTEVSIEREDWQHGAFTRTLLEALSGSNYDIDIDHNGVISFNELVKYLRKNLLNLTGTQHLGVTPSFDGDSDLLITALPPADGLKDGRAELRNGRVE
jgi:hypothetical protein